MNLKIAHIDRQDNVCRLHYLSNHLEGVAVLAEQFAACFDAAQWANLAGLLITEVKAIKKVRKFTFTDN